MREKEGAGKGVRDALAQPDDNYFYAKPCRELRVLRANSRETNGSILIHFEGIKV